MGGEEGQEGLHYMDNLTLITDLTIRDRQMLLKVGV